jgi:hypothetical protein
MQVTTYDLDQNRWEVVMDLMQKTVDGATREELTQHNNKEEIFIALNILNLMMAGSNPDDIVQRRKGNGAIVRLHTLTNYIFPSFDYR